MDWPHAINRNRDALLRIVAGLFALVGLVEGGALTTLPRHLYRAVMLVLRPAEAAVRRLVVMVARGFVFAPCAPRSGSTSFNPLRSSGEARLPAFLLIDPLKRFADDEYCPVTELPRISVPGFLDPVFPVHSVPTMHDPINAAQLGRRLLALKQALETLPIQARRLARWRARRDFVLHVKKAPHRVSPFRPGWPPGYHKRQRHDVDEVLLDCHSLALYASAPDTS